MLNNRNSPTFWSATHNQHDYKSYISDGFIELHSSPNQALLEQINDYLYTIESNHYEGRINEEDGISIRSQFNIHSIFPEILSNLINTKIYNIACSILGDEPLIYQSHINFKKSKCGGSYDWHSDYTYWKSQDGMLEPRAISIAIPLGPHNSQNGGLQILRKSHLFYYHTTLEFQKQWKLDEIKHGPSIDRLKSGLIPFEIIETFPKEDIYQADLNFGDTIIFDANTWHYSGSNLSDMDRNTFFLILYSEKTPFDNNMNGYRPNYITCRKKMKLKSFLK